MPNTDILLRELNHRVKNNFQIIVSLMNLQKRMLPEDGRSEIRFVQEHVQAMAVAYRLVYANDDTMEVSFANLLTEVISELRQIAGLEPEHIRIDGCCATVAIGLDQAIAVCLYLAVVMPLYLDHARRIAGLVVVTATIDGQDFILSISGNWADIVEFDALHARLAHAYALRLKAVALPGQAPSDRRLQFSLDDHRSPVAGVRRTALPPR